MKPLYEHDSDCCTFLGIFKNADLYYCKQMNNPTVIARFSSDPSDYSSGLCFADRSPFLGEAKRLALQQELL